MKPTVVLFIESYYRGEDVVCSIAVKIIIENFNLVQTVTVLLFAGRQGKHKWARKANQILFHLSSLDNFFPKYNSLSINHSD